MDISRISDLQISTLGNHIKPTPTSTSLEEVGQTFQQALHSLDQTQEKSDGLMQQLAAGEDVDIHQVMVSVEETDVSFRIAMAIRDRLVDAYREMMRMSV